MSFHFFSCRGSLKARLLAVLVAVVTLVPVMNAEEVVVGAARTDQDLPALKGKRVALFSNHTGMVGDRHTLDIMLDNGINVVAIFSPEHGFRGKADAGAVEEQVKPGIKDPSGYWLRPAGEESGCAVLRSTLCKGASQIVCV